MRGLSLPAHCFQSCLHRSLLNQEDLVHCSPCRLALVWAEQRQVSHTWEVIQIKRLGFSVLTTLENCSAGHAALCLGGTFKWKHRGSLQTQKASCGMNFQSYRIRSSRRVSGLDCQFDGFGPGSVDGKQFRYHCRGAEDMASAESLKELVLLSLGRENGEGT